MRIPWAPVAALLATIGPGAYYYTQRQKPAYDLIIRGSDVFDGERFTGRLDIGIRDGTVALIGGLWGVRAAREIDAQGQIAAPGFIDTHVHIEPNMEPKTPMRAGNYTGMGVTTVITGNCGVSFGDFDASLKAYDANGGGQVRVVSLVGHNTIRRKVMGARQKRAPTAAELDGMREMLESALRSGAAGLSVGLEYYPGIHAQRAEIEFLARETARWNRVLAVHLRNEGADLDAALSEILAVARAAKVKLHISHLKIAAKKHWGGMRRVLDRLDAARKDLPALTYDVYPYTASSSSQDLMLPAEFRGSVASVQSTLKDGEEREELIEGMIGKARREGFEDFSFAQVSWIKEHDLEGRRVSEDWSDVVARPRLPWLRALVPGAALAGQVANIATIFRLGGAQMIYHVMDENDVALALAGPHAVVGTDSGVRGPTDFATHPRGSGSTVRLLTWLVQERRVLAMEDALARMTSRPADIFGLPQLGRIAVGHPADLVILDPAALKDRATFESPLETPGGITSVILGGRPVSSSTFEGRAVRVIGNATGPAAKAGPAPKKARTSRRGRLRGK